MAASYRSAFVVLGSKTEVVKGKTSTVVTKAGKEKSEDIVAVLPLDDGRVIGLTASNLKQLGRVFE